MRRLAIVLSLCLAGCAAKQPVRPVAPAALAPAPPVDGPKPIKITVHLCADHLDTPDCQARIAKWQLLKDERDLIALLTEDFDKRGHDWIDLDLEKHIKALEAQVQKESQ